MSRPQSPYGIVGLGLVGGSLALALKRAHLHCEIVGVDPDPSTRKAALAKKAVDEAADSVDERLARCGLIVVATPIGNVRDTFSALAAVVSDDVLITDVAGVKQPVAEWATELLPGRPFVGGHPMAGGERGGFEHARPALFDGAPVALCGEGDAVDELAELWRSVGATPTAMSADEHDRIVARTSHLPYLLAVAQTVLGEADDRLLMGAGFKDSTRHAGFSPEIMAATVCENRHLPATLRHLARHLDELAKDLESNGQAVTRAAEQAAHKKRES